MQEAIIQEAIIDRKYEVTTVEKTSAPDGMLGDNWYRYVIQKGKSVVESKKTGTLKAVTEHAKGVAEMINQRNGKSSQKKK